MFRSHQPSREVIMSHSTGLLRFVYAYTMVLTVLPAWPLLAQVTTATLAGQVRDSSAGVSPGAAVVATHEGTGVPRETVTDERGEFVLSALPNGAYTIRIELQGFKTAVHQALQLGAG